jgi:Uma2 family endonuclease
VSWKEASVEPAAHYPTLRGIDDFLAWVEPQRERYEFVRGRLTMMAGGSEVQNDIQVNLLTALKARLRGTGCKPNGSDLMVRIDDRTGRFPDATVTCGREGGHLIRAPVAVFEILSPGTEAEDRGPKRREYQGLPSVQHFVMLAQDAPRAELFTRSERGWLFQELEGLGAELPLDALGITLPLAELYDGIPLPTADPA